MSKRYVILVFCELLVFALLLSGCGSAKAKDFSESFELDGSRVTVNATAVEDGYGFSDAEGDGAFDISGGSADVHCKVIGYDEAYEYGAEYCMSDSYVTFSVDSDTDGFGFRDGETFYHVTPINDDYSLLTTSSEEDALFAATSAVSVSVH